MDQFLNSRGQAKLVMHTNRYCLRPMHGFFIPVPQKYIDFYQLNLPLLSETIRPYSRESHKVDVNMSRPDEEFYPKYLSMYMIVLGGRFNLEYVVLDPLL